MNQERKLGEKCGVIGVWTASAHAPAYAKQGLSALQHRGQESSGISVLSPSSRIVTYKGMGLVPHVLTNDVLKKLGKSKVAIGHNRYSTSGKSTVANAQPIELRQGKFKLAIAHNGNIPRLTKIRNKLKTKIKTSSDTTLMAALIMQERRNYQSWEEALTNTLPYFDGAYCLVMLTNDGSLFAMRDPYGIRPLCLGKLPDGWIIASESVSLDVTGAEYVRDIKQGEIIKIDPQGNVHSYFFGEPKRAKYCLFEYIYFSRPDSFLNGRRVRAGRELSGKFLAERITQKGLKPDVIVPTFDSGYPAAKGVADYLKLPIVDAITTSHYVGRTFIQPGQENRVAAVSGKHNIVPDDIVGKNVLVVDDSAVRLTTSSVLVKGLKAAGAKKIFMGFASPPVVNRCDLGIDMRAKKHLPAAKFAKKPLETIEKEMAKLVAADDVVYLSPEDTAKAMNGEIKDFYYSPFGGPHPIRGKQEKFKQRRKKITEKAKITVFVSGSGTNLQRIIDSVEQGDLQAEIVGVLANKKDAYGLIRAKNAGIPTTVLEYTGKFSDTKKRNEYDQSLVEYVKTLSADVIVLAGWMHILGDDFLNAVQKMQIPVINLHPALMTENFDETVATSRGIIPVLRGQGKHIFKETIEKNYPVGGITVHQLLPGNTYDVGPIIMKAEVRRHADDTPETWESRIHEMEYMIMPTAIKRVLHVINHNNIDISKGEFPW